MVNIFLIVVAIIMAILVLALSFYIVFLYQHEEDKNTAWLPKIVVICGLALACFNVLLLPYDVASRMDPSTGISQGINTELCWEIVLYTIAILTFAIVPFCIFFYEGYEPEQSSIGTQLKPAFCYGGITAVLFATIAVLCWLFAGTAKIPIEVFEPQPQSVAVGSAVLNTGVFKENKIEVPVAFLTYVVALMCVIGWVFFIIFAGIGLASVPIDGVRDFIDRPIPISLEEYNKRKDACGHDAMKLMERGQELEKAEEQGAKGYFHRKRLLKFQQEVSQLETQYEKIDKCYNGAPSVLAAYLGLVLAILGGIVSFLWLLHILIHNILGKPFLSKMLEGLDSAFSLFGVVAYGLFAFYLLLCVVKGCARFGFNLVLFTIHPMKIHGTMMNGLLFNTGLILLCSTPCVQFSVISFSSYVSNTSASVLFLLIRNLSGVGAITQYIQYAMGVIALISIVCLAFLPRCKRGEGDD